MTSEKIKGSLTLFGEDGKSVGEIEHVFERDGCTYKSGPLPKVEGVRYMRQNIPIITIDEKPVLTGKITIYGKEGFGDVGEESALECPTCGRK